VLLSSDPTVGLADMLQNLPDAVVVAAADGRVVHANPALTQLLGLDPDELVGSTLSVLMPERLRSAHNKGFARFFATGERRLIGNTVQVPALHRDGREVAVDLTLSVVSRPNGAELVIAVLRDARPQIQLEQQLEVSRHLSATLHVTQALGDSPNAQVAFERMLPALCERLDWDAASLWVPHSADGALVCSGVWRAPGLDVPALRDALVARTFAPGEGMPGEAWQGRRVVVMDDLLDNPRFTRRDAAQQDGLRTGVAFPVMRGATVLAVCELFSRETRPVSDELVEVLSSAGRQLGQFLDRLHAEGQARELARTLQRSLLPPRLPDIPGISLGARFRAGGDGMMVGGDTYDVTALGDGRWMVLIADVCGKGAAAATVTALARYTARAAADGGAGPSAILAAVNAALLHDDQTSPLPYLTAACLLLRPNGSGADGQVSIAGHPLPVLRRADGTLEEVGEPGLLLGVDPDVTHLELPVALAAGDTLVLHTDGVTEARDAAGRQFGEEGLRSVLTWTAGAGADATAQSVLDAVERHVLASPHGRDDMAVLSIQC